MKNYKENLIDSIIDAATFSRAVQFVDNPRASLFQSVAFVERNVTFD